MERTTFLQHYRIRVRSDGSPYELDRNGATSYEAVDEMTGEPVSLKLIAVDSIDSAALEQFGQHASAAQKLRHVNIAKVLDFGREGDDFVYISEHLPGETLAAWVGSHGPMPVDAALRVVEQIVSVLSSASFHKLPFPSIQPSEIIVVPGQTPEGTWPLVKLTNFGLPPLKPGTQLQPTDSGASDPAVATQQAAHSQELAHATEDIRSEISSLGAMLYFLLTGVALSPEALHARPKLEKFPKPLRNLVRRMLHPNPDQRPKDLVVLAEMIRECLSRTERRREFADRYGIPYRRTIPRPAEIRSARLVRVALVFGVLLLIAVLLAPVVLPKTISRMIHGSRDTKDIGVLVGVPESSPSVSAQSHGVAPATVTSPQANTAITTQGTNAGVASQQANAPAPSVSQPPLNAAPTSNSPPPYAGSQNLQQTQTSNAQAQAAVAGASPADSPGAVAQDSSEADTKSAGQTSANAQSDTTSESSSRSKKKTVASSSRRSRGNAGLSEDFPQGRRGSVRARVVGITSDGRLILRLPSGRTATVSPDSGEDEFTPRRRRRPSIGRDEMLGSPPGLAPDYFPND